MIKVWIEDNILRCASQVCNDISCPRFNKCEGFKGLQLINSVRNENRIDKEPMIEVNRRVIGEMVLELIAENKQLKEALRKCDPFVATTGSGLYRCEFCLEKEHTKDCEYVRLIQESEDK